MPNHIFNRVSFDADGDKLQEIVDFLAGVDDGGEATVFDFNKIVTQPKFSDDGGADGLPDWYSWRLAHWGTKWDAYDIDFWDGNQITFSTAWSTPTQVIKALSKHFPDVTIWVTYYDEDLGSNLGEYTCEGGAVVELTEYSSGSPEAHQFLLDEFGIEMDEYLEDCE
jgi:hypothetical protein